MTSSKSAGSQEKKAQSYSWYNEINDEVKAFLEDEIGLDELYVQNLLEI